MNQPQPYARILGQIERMAAHNEDPTNDIHAWVEVQLTVYPEMIDRMTPAARHWLATHGLLPEGISHDN
jgi:hypothetical protein